MADTLRHIHTIGRTSYHSAPMAHSSKPTLEDLPAEVLAEIFVFNAINEFEHKWERYGEPTLHPVKFAFVSRHFYAQYKTAEKKILKELFQANVSERYRLAALILVRELTERTEGFSFKGGVNEIEFRGKDFYRAILVHETAKKLVRQLDDVNQPRFIDRIRVQSKFRVSGQEVEPEDLVAAAYVYMIFEISLHIDVGKVTPVVAQTILREHQIPDALYHWAEEAGLVGPSDYLYSTLFAGKGHTNFYWPIVREIDYRLHQEFIPSFNTFRELNRMCDCSECKAWYKRTNVRGRFTPNKTTPIVPNKLMLVLDLTQAAPAKPAPTHPRVGSTRYEQAYKLLGIRGVLFFLYGDICGRRNMIDSIIKVDRNPRHLTGYFDTAPLWADIFEGNHDTIPLYTEAEEEDDDPANYNSEDDFATNIIEDEDDGVYKADYHIPDEDDQDFDAAQFREFLLSRDGYYVDDDSLLGITNSATNATTAANAAVPAPADDDDDDEADDEASLAPHGDIVDFSTLDLPSPTAAEDEVEDEKAEDRSYPIELSYETPPASPSPSSSQAHALLSSHQDEIVLTPRRDTPSPKAQGTPVVWPPTNFLDGVDTPPPRRREPSPDF